MDDVQALDFNLLKALHALLVTQSVTAAASRTGVGQPAMSAALRRLREQLGDPLLVRRGNRMLPTPLAERLASPVAEAVASVGRVLSPAESRASWPASITIATTDEVVALLGPRLLARLAAEAPATKLVFLAIDASYNRLGLELGQVDLVISEDWTAPGQLRRRRLLSSEFVGVVAKGHKPPRGLAAYTAADHLLVAPLGGRRGLVDDALADEGRSRHVAAVVPTFAAAAPLMAAHPLVCTVPELAVDVCFPRGGVQRFRLPLALPPARYDAFWHARVHGDRAHQHLRRVLTEVASEPPSA